MPFSLQDVNNQLYEKALLYSATPTICPCRSYHTAVVRSWEVVSMANSWVRLQIQIATEGPLVEHFFGGQSLVPLRCAHDISRSFEALVTMDQWTHVIRHSCSFVVIAAKLVNCRVLDTTIDFAGVLPMPNQRSVPLSEDLSCAEFFCGGFSGWSQTIHQLSDANIPAHVRFAIDSSRPCIDAYVKTFGAVDAGGPWSFTSFPNDLPPKIAVEADIRGFKWTHLLGSDAIDILMASPPCPPWSKANHAPGLANEQGCLMLDTVGLIKIIGPRAFALENVGGLASHAHFRYIRDFIRFAGYHVRWCQTANLREILPQNRDRLLLLAIKVGDETILPHICVAWPQRLTPSLYSAGVIMKRDQIPDSWKENAELPKEVLDMYLHDKFLPHGHDGVVTTGPWKKPRHDVGAYRIRFPQDAFACVMAAYSQGHKLPQRNLEFSGLYGALLLDNDHLRFLVLPEIMCLMGATQDLWFSHDMTLNFQMLGNAIAIPHAAICIANLVATLKEGYDGHAVRDLFNRLVDRRLMACDLSISPCDQGWMIAKMFDCIPPTVPIHDFVQVFLQFEEDIVMLRCERELDLWGVLHISMYHARPLRLGIKPMGHPDRLIPLPKPFLLLSDVHHVTVSSRLVLRLHPQVQMSPEVLVTPTVVVVAEGHVVALHLGKAGSVQNVADVVMDCIEEDGLCPTNQFGSPLDPMEPTPYHFMLMPTSVKPIDFDVFQMVRVKSVAGVFSFGSAAHVIESLVLALRTSGIAQMVRTFGWRFVSIIHDQDDESELQVTLMKMPGVLSIEPSDMHNCLTCLLFLAELANTSVVGTLPDIDVHLRLLGHEVWSGKMHHTARCSFFDRVWEKVSAALDIKAKLRYIIAGKQVNPEWSVHEYMNDQMHTGKVVRIHTVLELRGGGPIRLVPNDLAMDDDRQEPARGSGSQMDIFRLDRHFHIDAVEATVKDWLALPSQRQDIETSAFLSMKISEEDGIIIWKDEMETLFRFLKALKEIGAELIMGKLGWTLSVHFIAWEDVPLGRIMLFPRPVGPVVSIGLIRSFLQAVMLRFAIPCHDVTDEETVEVKIKAFHGGILHQLPMPASMKVSDLYDAWDQSCHLTIGPCPIRVIICGRQASPEFPLQEYAKVGSRGQMRASVDWIMPLSGGGASETPSTPSSAKNMLATWLLTQGSDMSQVAPFVSAIAKAGPMPIADILQIKDKSQKVRALKKLSESMQLTMPDLHVKHQANKRSFQDRNKHMQQLDISQIRIKDGMFANQDDTACLQRAQPGAGEAGISVVWAQESTPWLQHTVSADEQAILILGTCPCTDRKTCLKLQVPAYVGDEPIILDTCMHQLGQKHVKILDVKSQNVPITPTDVLSVTAFKDEVGSPAWEKIIDTPVKASLGFLFYDMEQPKLTCPPWGRTFQNASGKVDKTDPSSFQFHCRVPSVDLKKWLKISGKRGIYTVPKTEDRQLSNEYQVVWLNMDHVQLTIAAGAHEKSLGIVRTAGSCLAFPKAFDLLVMISWKRSNCCDLMMICRLRFLAERCSKFPQRPRAPFQVKFNRGSRPMDGLLVPSAPLLQMSGYAGVKSPLRMILQFGMANP